MRVTTKVIAFGGCSEVGRSCFLLFDKDRKVVLDCGLKLFPRRLKRTTESPGGIDEEADISAVLLSHAHLDHSGYIPALTKAGLQDGRVFMTEPTHDICQVLWKDSIKIEGPTHFSTGQINKVNRITSTVKYKKKIRIADGIYATFFDAGHTLGSASILVDWDGQLIFYSGDINAAETPFHKMTPINEINDEIAVAFVETTNSDKEIPDRQESARQLTKAILERYAAKGKVLIPSFAVGRSQEIQAYLVKEFHSFIEKNIPVYVDGMILTINQIYGRYFNRDWIRTEMLDYCKDIGLPTPLHFNGLIPVCRNPEYRNNEEFRKGISAEKKPQIILTTSGMMEGGPVHSYLRYIGNDPNVLLAIVGYQVEGTIGHEIENGVKKFDLTTPWGERFALDLQLQVRRFFFSGHSGKKELLKYIKDISSPKTFVIHGSNNNGFQTIAEREGLTVSPMTLRKDYSLDV